MVNYTMSTEVNTELIEQCIELSEQIANPFYMNEVAELVGNSDLMGLYDLRQIMREYIKQYGRSE